MPEKTPRQSAATLLMRVAFVLLALLPFLLGAFAVISNYADYGRNKTIALIPSVVFFALMLAVLRIRPRKVREPVILVALFAAAILIRALSQAYFNTQPISDYMDAINAAIEFTQGPMRSLETARFPYWGFYRITLSYLFRVFSNPIQTARITNLLLSGLTVVSMYLLGKKIFGSRRLGFIATSFFIVDPANILYINLPSGEHFFVLLFPLAVMLFLALFGQSERKMAMRVVMAVLLGITLGLMDMFKPVAVILLIAMVITLGLTEWLSAKKEGSKEKRTGRFWMQALMIALVLISYFGAKEASFSLIAHYALIPPNRYGTGWTLRVGLDMENGGRVSNELAYAMHTRYHASGEDYRTVNAQLTEEALEQIKGRSIRNLFHFAREKFTFTWGSNQDFTNWATNTQMDGGLLPAYDAEQVSLLVDPFSDAFLAFSLVLSSAGAFYSAYKRGDKGTLVIGLFILGFTLLLLVSEVQQRYRSVVASAIPFFAAYGLFAVKNGVCVLFGKVSRKDPVK